jgi:TetR/AcrR family transcriptional repressor of nem operon
MARHSVKQQIVDAGLAQLHARGYAACSVDDITKAAGVPKGSFYNHFASKEDFAVEAVRRYFDVTGWPTSFAQTSAVARLRAGFADHSAAIRGELAEGLDAWSAIVTELVAGAQRDGEISAARDPAALGRFIVNAWEGALMRSRVVRNGQPIDDFFEMIFGSVLGDAR